MRRGSRNVYKVNRSDAVKAKAAAAEAAIREPPPKTWSATHPAYYYTELCPKPTLRRKPKGGDTGGQVNSVPVHRRLRTD